MKLLQPKGKRRQRKRRIPSKFNTSEGCYSHRGWGKFLKLEGNLWTCIREHRWFDDLRFRLSLSTRVRPKVCCKFWVCIREHQGSIALKFRLSLSMRVRPNACCNLWAFITKDQGFVAFSKWVCCLEVLGWVVQWEFRPKACCNFWGFASKSIKDMFPFQMGLLPYGLD